MVTVSKKYVMIFLAAFMAGAPVFSVRATPSPTDVVLGVGLVGACAAFLGKINYDMREFSRKLRKWNDTNHLRDAAYRADDPCREAKKYILGCPELNEYILAQAKEAQDQGILSVDQVAHSAMITEGIFYATLCRYYSEVIQKHTKYCKKYGISSYCDLTELEMYFHIELCGDHFFIDDPERPRYLDDKLNFQRWGQPNFEILVKSVPIMLLQVIVNKIETGGRHEFKVKFAFHCCYVAPKPEESA